MREIHETLTPLENGLKLCYLRRTDIHEKVLSPKEMAEYIAWMHREYGTHADIDALTKPHMMHGGNVTKLPTAFRAAAKVSNPYQTLSNLFHLSREESVFLENADITVTQSLRYMPANWHTNTYFEIYYTLSGDCPVIFEEEAVTLRPGDVLLIPPSVIHANACNSDDCILLDFMVRASTFREVFLSHLTGGNLMSLFFRQALGSENTIAYLRFHTEHDPAIKQLAVTLFEEYNHQSDYTPAMLNALMNVFFLRILERYEDTAHISKRNGLHWQPNFNALFRYIQDNYQTATLQETARVCGYSERQIIRIIKNCTGLHFSQLITALKMHAAIRMLRAGYGAEAISEAIGYGSVSSFYRAFKQHFCCTPAQYLKT